MAAPQPFKMAAPMNTCYISSGCNKSPHCADWGRNNLLCYGSCQAVVVCKPEVAGSSQARVLHTLSGHKANVNCVKWISKYTDGLETELVSGSVDNSIMVWGKQGDKFVLQQTLTDHQGAVTALDAAYLTAEDSLPQGTQLRAVIVSASTDSTVKIWIRNSDKGFIHKQNINFGCGFALDLSLIRVPGSETMMLAAASDDMKVHIYMEQEAHDDMEFVPVITLPGHEDWVRAVDFAQDDGGDLLLASASQDFLIRVWRLSPRVGQSVGSRSGSVMDLPPDQDIQMRETTFSYKIKGDVRAYAVSLETVLSGHENWIYSVCWKPSTVRDGVRHQDLSLLSVSMDKTMILWRPETESGVWTEQMRVGEVGGNTLGLYGGMFGPRGDSILAHGYQGAFHHWTYNQDKANWQHVVTVSGHFDSVEDIVWDRRGGNFLLSCSLDETVRLHAPWVSTTREVLWYEIARPQIHGYELNCIAMVNRYQYTSGGNEKVVRVFDAPDNFVENFCNLCAIDMQKEKTSQDSKTRPVGASVPALGLSNKAIFTGGVLDMMADLEIKPGENEQYADNVFTNVTLTAPPSEEHLLQNTLWPEVQKLYGHGYEIFALDCDPDGKILASACKATRADVASVILWDTATWQQVMTLEGHALTVTQIAFSKSGEYLLTVSRDRTWYMYKRGNAEAPVSELQFVHVMHTENRTSVHTRIIWSCCWAPDDKYFFTASRDKKVAVWYCPAADDKEPKLAGKLDVADSATAVDSAHMCLADGGYLVAVGMDNGQILLYSWLLGRNSPWQQLVTLDNSLAHHKTVKRLKFRLCLGLAGIHDNNPAMAKAKDKEDWLQLASCSSDHSVKIFNIRLSLLTKCA